jgi:hypothetical protein
VLGGWRLLADEQPDDLHVVLADYPAAITDRLVHPEPAV